MTEIPGMVDRIGRAIAGLRRGDYEKDFALFDAEACAILVAHEAALRDAGMVIVPREPTEEMLKAGGDWYVENPDEDARDIWLAMIAAAHPCPDKSK